MYWKNIRNFANKLKDSKAKFDWREHKKTAFNSGIF